MQQDRTHGGLPHLLGRLVFPLFLVPLVGCGSGGGGGEDPLEAQLGDVVGALEVELPQGLNFLLRGTLPVPPGTWRPEDGITPLTVLDHDGKIAPTQVEVVSRYPNAIDGADVVQLIARVNRPPAMIQGDRTTYQVAEVNFQGMTPPSSMGVDDLTDGPDDVPPALEDLFSKPGAFVIEAKDVFGNSYYCNPIDGTGTVETVHYGRVSAEMRVHQVMKPLVIVPGPQGTLPHLLGVHAYLSTYQGEEIVGFDLRFHNAHSGNDPTTPIDDPLDDVYFTAINLYLPEGWVVVQDYLDPFLSWPVQGTGYTLFPLVRQNADGTMHKMEWQAQFNRRLAVAPAGKWQEASAFLRGAGLGFSRRGSDPQTGREYWSWWNEDTARWFPQSHLLPSLEHVGLPTVRQGLANELAKVQQHLELGTSDGDYPVKATVLGWSHPYGVAYGGMAGGAEIYLFDGVRTVESASKEGYELYRILHRMHSDRMPSALYNLDGEPTAVEDWVVESGSNDYVPFWHFMVPSLGGIDPFGISSAPTFQQQFVQAQGLEPAYAATLDNYDPHDYQHLIRYSRSAKVLTWLANDSLAKDDLRMQAENFRLSYHQYYNSPYQHVQVTGLLADQEHIDKYGAVGFSFGRGEGWALDCAAAAYATGDKKWRAEVLPWFNLVADVLVGGQGACNGFIQATVSPKFLGGKYRARQQIEQSITENAVRGTIESVFRGEDVGTTAALEDVLEDSFYAQISDMAWGATESAPWAITAVGPKDNGPPMWCSFAQMPSDGTSTWNDSYQNWSSFAYAYELTGDPIFLVYAQLQAGGGPLLGTLQGDGLVNIQNKAALLALGQKMAGIL